MYSYLSYRIVCVSIAMRINWGLVLRMCIIRILSSHVMYYITCDNSLLFIWVCTNSYTSIHTVCVSLCIFDTSKLVIWRTGFKSISFKYLINHNLHIKHSRIVFTHSIYNKLIAHIVFGTKTILIQKQYKKINSFVFF